MRCPVTTKVCVVLAGPPARQPWTWVCSPSAPYRRACHTDRHNTVKLRVSIFFPGTDKYGFGFGGTGKKSNNKQFDSYGEVIE